MKKRQDKLVGPVVSLPTFVDDDHNLLLDRQAKHIRWLMDHGIGVDGNGVLLAAGGYGEGYFLDDGELFAIIDVLVDTAGDKAPTMVGVFDLNARTAARRSRYAGDAGIDFIELGLPHYSCPSEEDVYLYTKYVNDNADVGLMNYNNFWVTPAPKYEITRSLMERFIDLENVVGFKWSSASPAHYVGLLKLFAEEFNFIDNGMMNSQGPDSAWQGSSTSSATSRQACPSPSGRCSATAATTSSTSFSTPSTSTPTTASATRLPPSRPWPTAYSDTSAGRSWASTQAPTSPLRHPLRRPSTTTPAGCSPRVASWTTSSGTSRYWKINLPVIPA